MTNFLILVIYGYVGYIMLRFVFRNKTPSTKSNYCTDLHVWEEIDGLLVCKNCKNRPGIRHE